MIIGFVAVVILIGGVGTYTQMRNKTEDTNAVVSEEQKKGEQDNTEKTAEKKSEKENSAKDSKSDFGKEPTAIPVQTETPTLKSTKNRSRPFRTNGRV